MENERYKPLTVTGKEPDVRYPWQLDDPDQIGAFISVVPADTLQLLCLQGEPKTIYDYWIHPLTLAAGTHPKRKFNSTGYLKKGQQFGGILYSSTFRKGSDAIWNLNYSTYYSAIANPASLLYTQDCRNRIVHESAWAGSVCSTTALRACGYIYPYASSTVKNTFREKTDQSIGNLQAGDILWRKGHVAGIVEVITGADGDVSAVWIIEQACNVMLFRVTAENWPTYFSGMWTGIFRGEEYMRKAPETPVVYPENLSIIFERGNNTYVTDHTQMLFYIPTADTVYLTKDGRTTSHATAFFPTQTVNGTRVYDLACLFNGIGDYYFHTNENPTDICIKVISTGSIVIDPQTKTAALQGYHNCRPLGYSMIRIKKSETPSYNFHNAPEGYTASMDGGDSFRLLEQDTFHMESIPENVDGWKIVVYYDTGYGWAKALSENVMA